MNRGSKRLQVRRFFSCSIAPCGTVLMAVGLIAAHQLDDKSVGFNQAARDEHPPSIAVSSSGGARSGAHVHWVCPVGGQEFYQYEDVGSLDVYAEGVQMPACP